MVPALPRGAGASKLGRFSPFPVKIKVLLSTNFVPLNEIVKLKADKKTEGRFEQKI